MNRRMLSQWSRATGTRLPDQHRARTNRERRRGCGARTHDAVVANDRALPGAFATAILAPVQLILDEAGTLLAPLLDPLLDPLLGGLGDRSATAAPLPWQAEAREWT